MADNNNQQNIFNHGDILGTLSGNVSQINGNTADIADNTELLRSIDRNLSRIIQNSSNWSQQDARNRIYDTIDENRRSNDAYSNPYQRRYGNNSRRSNTSANIRNSTRSFTDAFFEELTQQTFGSRGFRNRLNNSMAEFAHALGVEVNQMPDLFGRTLAQELRQTNIGSRIANSLQDSISNTMDSAMDRMRSGINRYYEYAVNSGRMDSSSANTERQQWDSVLDNIEGFDGAAEAAISAIRTEGLSAGAALSGIAKAAGPIAVEFLAVSAGAALLDHAIEELQHCFDPLTNSFKSLWEEMKKTSNRFFESERKKISDQTARMKADIQVMIETPFKIMEQAANEWYAAWDNNLKTINATQGYTKEDLQNLMASYAQRLRAENLSDVVSAADISTNLAQVLESGLSGKAAEEFAYVATKLNNAFPTENFFSYASTYASIAANQLALGKSQSQAIESANEQLTQFASNLLYSNRELAGGFSTNLSNASSLLEDAVKIANTAGISDSSMISGVLTAISSVVGAIAPDLASGVTDAIVNAALGGNSDELVALRSQAGTGAANTAFLNAFARDPQKVLNTLFTNLSNLQNMSKDNFMEVAESLSSTFGLSVGAFTRIDFNAIASAVSQMEVNLNAINDNFRLLQQGETTTTAEQLKMQQINEMILNEGLSYVLDNEAARSIQEHMWQQEIAAEIMETEYSVDLTGKALEFLSGIRETINNILNFLNPFSWMKKVTSIAETFTENLAMTSDIRQMLEEGKVGSGNKESLYNLTTYDVDRLTNKPGNLLEIMGGTSKYQTASSIGAQIRYYGSLGLENNNRYSDRKYRDIFNKMYSDYGNSNEKITSKYNWNFASKNMLRSLESTYSGSNTYVPGQSSANATLVGNSSSSQAQITSKGTANLTEFFDTMESYVKSNKSFDDWVSSSKDYGISNLKSAIQPYEITMSDLEGKYQEYESAQGSEYRYNQDALEQEFWKSVTQFIQEDFPAMFDQLLEKQDTMIELMTHMDSILNLFYESWIRDWLQQAWPIDWLQQAWQSNWIDQAWRAEWLDKSWNTDWLQNAWRAEWIEKAWKEEWLNTAWYKAWIEEAWKNGWLNGAWAEEWIEKAWKNDWLTEAWNTNWLEKAWNEAWLEKAWNTEWLEKAWKESWLEKAWGEAWLAEAWNTEWLEKAWNKTWIEDNWKTAWLQKAWSNDWLKEAWATNWLEKAWNTEWLNNNWKQLWVKETWKNAWVKETWTNQWVKEAFEKRFVNDVIKVLWGNRWWEFFNIFRDRFGGITTTPTKDGSNGKTSVDTTDLYRIYTAETGKAAANALKDVKNEEKSETGDAVLSLAKQLTKNSVELKDPQVQTNVLLSQILIVLEAIMQAENTSGGASLATTLAALGMGSTQSNIANTAGTSKNTTGGGITV